MSQEFLPKCYYDIAEKVHKVLQSVQYLNFVIDESDDKAKRRICNLIVNTLAHGSFFVKNYHTQAESQSANYLADLITPGIEETCNYDIQRVNNM